MKLRQYPGLFEDGRTKGLWTAVGVSLVLHTALFFGYSRFHISRPPRVVFSPFQMVDLGSTKPGPGAKPGSSPRNARPVTKEPAAKGPDEAAKPKPPAEPPPKPKAEEQAKPVPIPDPPKPKAETVKPKPEEKAIPKLDSEPKKAPPKPEPKKPDPAEERVSERIAQLRSKVAKSSSQPEQSVREKIDSIRQRAARAGNDGNVREKIDAIRQRLGPPEAGGAGGGKKGEGGAVGARGGGPSLLHQLNEARYYNRLYQAVWEEWAIPPPLQGRGYTVIVSMVIDRQGKLLKSWVEERSGSDAFDQSALRALEKAQLPPIPPELPGDSLEVGFRFNEEGASTRGAAQ